MEKDRLLTIQSLITIITVCVVGYKVVQTSGSEALGWGALLVPAPIQLLQGKKDDNNKDK